MYWEHSQWKHLNLLNVCNSFSNYFHKATQPALPVCTAGLRPLNRKTLMGAKGPCNCKLIIMELSNL